MSFDTISPKTKLDLLEKLNTLIQGSIENNFMLNMEEYLLGSSLPDSLTGYVKPNFLKFQEMVKFFAERIEPWKTVLNKLLFYSDFMVYKKKCFSMSGVRYRAIQMGPVPNNYNSIYDFIYNKGEVDIVNIPFSDSVFGFKFKKMKNVEFNPELFNSSELDILELVCSDFSKMTTNEVIQFSHKEKAWIENEKDRKLIDYKYAFEIG